MQLDLKRLKQKLDLDAELERSSPSGATGGPPAEFQKILDRRDLNLTGPFWPLAHLRLARAAALMGDTGKSRKACQDLFALWKDAGADLPVLTQARQEYARLQQ